MAEEIQRRTLYDIETTLTALLEVDPAELTPELRETYEKELAQAIRAAPEKRERVAWRLFDLGQRAAVKRAAAAAHRVKAEELQQSAERFERDADRLKEYVLAVMRELPKPKRGVRTLEGTSATFKAKGVADAVEIEDEAKIPDEYKTVTVKMSLKEWQRLLVSNRLYPQEQERVSIEVSRSAVKEALGRTETCWQCKGVVDWFGPGELCKLCEGAGILPTNVPGARLLRGRLRLEVS